MVKLNKYNKRGAILKKIFFKKILNLVSFIFIFIILTSSIIVKADANQGYVSNLAEFINALARQQKLITLDEIDFFDEEVVLNYNVSIKAKDKTAKINNAHFVIKGSDSDEFSNKILFDSIVFDGGVDIDVNELLEGLAFNEVYTNEQKTKPCFDGDYGYYELIINNCSITNYASEIGPCLFVENVMNTFTKKITISNSNFFHNISTMDTIHVSNIKLDLTLTNSKFYDNYAYKAAGISVANGKALIDNIEVKDNHFVIFDVNTENFQSCGGGVYVGGTNVTLKNSLISNNETTYGGGLGISSAYSGEKTTIIENVVIKNNKAQYGGAMAIHSLQGQSINIINCDIIDNEATIGSSLYAMNYAFWNKNNGGIVNTFFTTFAGNKAEDNKSYSFYNVEKSRGEIGVISLKGCLILDNDEIVDNVEDYNVIMSLEDAKKNSLINDDYTINNKSQLQKRISTSVYYEWSDLLKNYKQELMAGRNILSDEKDNPSNNSSLWLYILIVSAIPTVIIIFIVLFVVKQHQKKVDIIKAESHTQECNQECEVNNEQELINSLSEREKKVAKALIELKSRKEIAEELYFSENTIKKDISAVYNKLEVKNKAELISKYRDYFN